MFILLISSFIMTVQHGNGRVPDGFTDEEMVALASGLANNGTLKKLCIRMCLKHTGCQGWEALASILRNPRSALKNLDFSHSESVNNHALGLLAESLRNNCKLEEMLLGWLFEERPRITNWKPLRPVLCDGTSIDATFDSNHTLGRVFHDASFHYLPSDVRALLHLNRDLGPVEAARHKIIDTHFSSSFSMEPFLDMDIQLFPRVMAWMAKDDYGKSLLYQFIKNSTLFE